jgi:hypothetical protein
MNDTSRGAVARLPSKTPVFLSYPTPHRKVQQEFIDRVCSYLDERGFAGRTLGVTDYDMDVPLKASRRLMLECNGLITIALARTYVEKGVGNFRTDTGSRREYPIEGESFTSPWSHIEAAMAYQIGLPVLIFRESGVLADGLLEKGVLGTYMPEVNLDRPLKEYFAGKEWLGIMTKWESYVRSVVENKGNPPRLY